MDNNLFETFNNGMRHIRHHEISIHLSNLSLKSVDAISFYIENILIFVSRFSPVDLMTFRTPSSALWKRPNTSWR